MKITIIGGGGIRTVNFINGLLDRCRKLSIDQVVLFDIDKEKLAVIEKLAKHVVKKKSYEKGEAEPLLLVSKEDDIRIALTGADYIVTTLRVGGDHARVMDETIALSHGVIGQETTGAGGFSMACRSIGALLSYCELAKEVAPKAWIFNFTNPSGLVTQTLLDAGFTNVIGICDAPSSTKTRIAEGLGLSEDELYTEFFGLNHLSWISSVKAGGKERIAELIKDTAFLNSVQEFSMFDPESFALTGYLPNEYLYYYYHREKALRNISSSGQTRGQLIEEVNMKMFQELSGMDIDHDPEAALQTFLYYIYIREYSYMSIETGTDRGRDIKKGSLEVPSGMGYAGVMLDCIEGLQSETEKKLVLSVPNHGAIPFLSDTDIIEITCDVSINGIQPVKIENIPMHCEILIRQVKAYENKASRAIREKSIPLAIDALTLHPLVFSFSLAKDLVYAYEKEYGSLF